jgi:hypothetical protein
MTFSLLIIISADQTRLAALESLLKQRLLNSRMERKALRPIGAGYGCKTDKVLQNRGKHT